jgi:iron(III) transport system substrate-binding protein
MKRDPAHSAPRTETWRQWLFDALGAAGGAWLLPLSILVLLPISVLWIGGVGRNGRAASNRVVVYVAQDQVYAEPLLAEFTTETGVRVATVFDSEAVKTVGLANRLLIERGRPQCDVFWGNEELRTRQLEVQGVWRATNGWAAFGYRSRRMMINTNFVAPLSVALPTSTSPALPAAPQSLLALTNAAWRGKVAFAYPLFGTTATHFLALRQHWGDATWEAWCRALAANRPLMVDGNSVVAKLVAKGEAWIGLTDSDDIAAVQREGAPVMSLPLEADSLLIPNTVAVVRDAPHPAAAERLFRWLRRPELAHRLVQEGALESAVRASDLRVLTPDWQQALAHVESGTSRLKEIFVR